ncbi:MAG: metallophosphoesterase [Fidelibacterota bacterium]|nr:MAG: metallophosphoesterase [Candidatus Neomarinimicrobiota bacterium]
MVFEQRYIVVGDVHGNWRDTEILLKKASYEPTKDRLIFVGDYNDHLPYSDFSVRKLIDNLIALHRKSPGDVFFIRGNHDLWFAEWLLHGGAPPESWYFQGGRETLASYEIVNMWGDQDECDKVPQPHKEFICDLVDQYYLDDHMLVIHGGFTTEMQMQTIAEGGRLSKEDLTRIVWDRYYIFSESHSAHALYQKYFAERYLITGHTPEGPFVNPCNPKWILANAASRGERLCAVVIEGDQEYSFVYA